jgi:hypothetical protein
LAIVLKSKIAGDIRVQAKEKVPAAVLGAAEAMKPHFDKCIDDFARRLSEFVSNAGNTLYKGISEILDRTMLERRAAGSQVEPLKQATSTHIEQIIGARRALDLLRGALWESEEPVPPPAS